MVKMLTVAIDIIKHKVSDTMIWTFFTVRSQVRNPWYLSITQLSSDKCSFYVNREKIVSTFQSPFSVVPRYSTLYLFICIPDADQKTRSCLEFLILNLDISFFGVSKPIYETT